MIIRGIFLILCLAVHLPGGDAVATLPVDAMERNSALQYWIAFSLLPKGDTPDWLKAMSASHAFLADPQAEQSESTVLRALHLGANCARGTFGSAIGLEECGFEALMPYLGASRTVSNLAIARANWRFQNRLQAAAIDDLMAVLALAADLSTEASFIEIMVAVSLQQKALRTLALYLPDCTPADRAVLMERIDLPRYQIKPAGMRYGEAIIWRRWVSHPELRFNDFARMEKSAPAGADADSQVKALIKAGHDPRFPAWVAETESMEEACLAMANLPKEKYRESVSRLTDDVLAGNPLMPFIVPVIMRIVETVRSLAIDREVIVRAAKLLDQSAPLAGMEGGMTIDGPLMVEIADETIVRIERPSPALPIHSPSMVAPKPYKLVIGHGKLLPPPPPSPAVAPVPQHPEAVKPTGDNGF